ncbi:MULTISPECIES: hypothetical protein [Thalassospira]|uniref:Uncharacterized protein n=2 Tax=Thalassospira TaxID=168934 RepID=A0A367W1E4_9PROT|nr:MULTISPECIES: hypothetical protein [Thalassospira]MDG4721700.1 hypothetical protein [Thalassospira sp. FZY0004]RCK31689.1 hypothetical protein TH19_20640 [Thalassospira profundimaris]
MTRDSHIRLAALLCGIYGVALAAYFLQQTAAVDWLPPSTAWPLSNVPNLLLLKVAVFIFMLISTYRAARRQITPHRWKRRLYQLFGWALLIVVLVRVGLDVVAGSLGPLGEIILFDVVPFAVPLFVLALGYNLSNEAKRRKQRYFETLGISPA